MKRPNFWRRKAREQGRSRWPWGRLGLLGALLGLVLLLDPKLVPPMGPTATRPEQLTAHFTRCGVGAGQACVIDGNSFRLGSRVVRIIQLDVPDIVHPRCAAEAALAQRSADRLVALLDDHPINLIGHRMQLTDGDGRELRLVEFAGRSVGATLIAEGLAARPMGIERHWCD